MKRKTVLILMFLTITSFAILASDHFLTALTGPEVSERDCPEPSSKTTRFWGGHVHSVQEDGAHS